jgi:hypothetical protein
VDVQVHVGVETDVVGQRSGGAPLTVSVNPVPVLATTSS